MKTFLSILGGFILGALVAGAWLTRYQVQLSATAPGMGFVTRLDRWTGTVAGRMLHPSDTRWWSTLSVRSGEYTTEEVFGHKVLPPAPGD